MKPSKLPDYSKASSCKRRRNFTLGLAIAAGATLFAAGQVRCEEPFTLASTPGKLPKDVIPRAYAVRVEPNLETRACKGSEIIDIEAVRPVRKIVLNALDLTISGAVLSGGKAPMPLTAAMDAGEQTVTLALPEELPAGKYQLAMNFAYTLHDLSQGLYIEHYDTASGKKMMLASQMEPTDARRMFPCWDEPAFRAIFQLSVSLPLPACEKFEAVSNMPLTQVNDSTAGGAGTREFVFAPTPPMASYLVALIAGELESVEGEADGVKIRVLTTEGKRESGRYALESAEKILAYYDEYFGIHYPLPKLDEIAVPGGFGGAMENWGAIVYSEPYLLYDPATSAPAVREDVFAVLAHEMSHQWFGDLVTMAWWDNLWLNEGFASWMGTKTTDHFNPDWQAWLRANSDKEDAMREDARKTTHPIQQPVKTEEQAMDAFDNITYLKGQSFIRMLESYLGPDVFRDGIRRYMAAHKYGSTTTADLWAALGEASGKPVAAFAQDWTLRPDFPVVTLGVDAGGKPALTQQRFTVRQKDAAPLIWKIPVIVEDAAAPGKTGQILLSNAGPAPVDLPWDKASVLKLNAGDLGYYRSEYSPEHSARLYALAGTLPEADRLNLLGDAWASAVAGRQHLYQYLDLLNTLRGDTGTAFAEHAVEHLKELRMLLFGTPAYEPFLAYARGFLGPQLQRVGWDAKPGEASTDGIVRADLIRALADAGDKGVLDEAGRRFEAFLKNPASLPGAIRRSVLHAAGIQATPARFDQLLALARSATQIEDKTDYYDALGATSDPALLVRALGLMASPEAPIAVLMRSVLPSAMGGSHPDIAWSFMQKHVRETMARLAAFSGSRVLSICMNAFSDEARADEFSAIVAGIPQMASSSEIAKDIEGMRIRADLKQRELSNVTVWLSTTLAPHAKP